MFAKSSNSALYDEAARSRLANCSDLPQKPPRRQRMVADARPQGASNVGATCGSLSHFSRLQKVLRRFLPELASQRIVMKRKCELYRQAITAGNSDTKTARTESIAAPNSAAKSIGLPANRKQFAEVAVAAGLQAPQAAASAVHVTPSQDMMALPSPSELDEDNTHLDDVALLTSIQRLSQHVEMICARLLGDRRSRKFTPESANCSKFIRVNTPPPQPDVPSDR